MKFIRNSLHDIAQVIRQYPLTFLFQMILGSSLLIWTQFEYNVRNSFSWLEKLAFFASFLFWVMLDINVFYRNRSSQKKHVLQLLFITIGIVYFIFTPTDLSGAANHFLVRLLFWSIAAILLFFAAFVRESQGNNGFWLINKNHLMRALQSFAFALVIFVGISLALTALEHLFNWDISHRTYENIAVLAFAFFAPFYFLAGLQNELDAKGTFPRWLRFLAQYIFIPIHILYGVILYTYAAKLLIYQSLPHGWVAHPAIWFSVLGIFIYAAVFPIRDKYPIFRFFHRLFPFSLWVPIALLMVSFTRRIGDYGLTESRYIGVVFGAWLLLFSLYYALSREKKLALVPFSLALLAVLASIGPWSAFSLSYHNQLNRLQEIAHHNHLWQENKIISASFALTFEDNKQMCSIIRYLQENHRLDAVESWLPQSLESIELDSLEAKRNDAVVLKVFKSLEIEDIRDWQQPPQERTYSSFHGIHPLQLDIQGYRYFADLSLELHENKSFSQLVSYADTSFVAEFDSSNVLQIHADTTSITRFDLNPFLEQLMLQYNPNVELGIEEMSLYSTENHWLLIRSIELKKGDDNQQQIQYMNAYLWMR